MLRNKLCEIFHKVQQSSSCHQKCRQILVNLYDKTSFEDFEVEFMRCVETLFCQDVQHKNVHVERSMEFAATFVTTVVLAAEKENETQNANDSEDIPTHPLLDAIIEDVLQYHNLDYVAPRYRSCQFINLLLRNLGDDAHIDVDLGNAIQTAMLKRLQDTKPFIRLQAVKALVRLQQPESSDCPVMKALVSHMYESSAMVRKEIVEAIAATPIIVPKIVERVRDCDYTVRLAAYRKCSVIGPKLITIVNRQLIVHSGFNEDNEAVKRFFLEDMLPKWLSAYNGNFLQLLHALKLDAYEEDLKKTEVLCKKVLEAFFKSQQLASIIEYLPIDETKLIPLDKLTSEAALYWCILVNYLRNSDNTEDYLDDVIPELVHFCTYIEKVFKDFKNKSLKDWQHLEYQQIFCQLLQIIGKYDLGDEVGRKALHKLVVDMLTVGKFSSRVIAEMISILERISPALDSLTIDVCHIISDIREPLTEQPPSQEKTRENDFKMAEFRVRINILTEERDDAVAKCDFETAALVKRQLIELHKKVEDLNAQVEAAKTVVRTSQNDPETLCKCLDILIAMLSHPTLRTLTASLRSCKDEFVMPLLDNDNLEIYQRVYKCIALCCCLDRQLTRENLKLMCTPIIVYKLLPHYDKPILLTSIAAVSDLLRIFGTEIFSNGNNDTNSTNSSKRRLNNGTRRLYTLAQSDDIDTFDFDSVACEDIVDVFLDMLDDESQDLREQGGRALCELVMSRIAVSPSLISRMILKWFNPLTEKHDQKLQQLLGNTFVYFAQRVEESEDVLEKAVIPVLTSIGNAPRTSPLADVDLDNALRFLAAITCIQKPTGFVNTHKNLAYSLCSKIAANPEDKCVPLYVKMLLHLELFLEDSVIIKELINQAQLVLEDVNDKAPKRNVQKFVFKLSKLLADNANQAENEGAEGGEVVNMPEGEASSGSSISLQQSTPSRVSLLPQSSHSSRTSMLRHATIPQRTPSRDSLLPQSSHSSRTSMLRQATIPDQKSQSTPSRDSLLPQSSHSSRTSMLRQPTISDPKLQSTPSRDSLLPQSNHSSRTSMLQQATIPDRKSSTPQPKSEEKVNGVRSRDQSVKNGECKSTAKQKSPPPTKNPIEAVKQSSDRLSHLSISEGPATKRRKRRGRSSKAEVVEMNDSEDTILHTIVENDEHEVASLVEDDLTIQTPTTSPSNSTSSSSSIKVLRRSKRIVVSETSSDSEAPKEKTPRRSLRRKKTKNS